MASRLDTAELMAAAEASTGLSDWGRDQSFRKGLDALIHSVNAMSPPEPFVDQASARIGSCLETKLHLVDDGKQYPEILDQSISAPMIVVGLPRTGTTVLYDLLALDPATRTPRDWEFFFPWPAPEAESWNCDPRIAAVNSINAGLLAAAPALADIHEFEATHSSECNLAFTHHFASIQFPAEWGVPEFQKWLISRPIEGRYAAHKRILQQLQWKGPRGRWLLKSPEHLFDLDGLLAAYPDASLVWTHRDPVMALSSLSSFQMQFTIAFGLERDPRDIGRAVFETWTTAMERAMQSRARDPSIDGRLIDISHKQVIADKPGVVRSIYERFGLPFTSQVEEIIRKEAAAADSERFGRLGKHKHDPANFGIFETEVRERMPLYYAHFGALFS